MDIKTVKIAADSQGAIREGRALAARYGLGLTLTTKRGWFIDRATLEFTAAPGDPTHQIALRVLAQHAGLL